MVKRREKLLRRLEELRALQASLTPFALRAATRSEVTLFDCPPLSDSGNRLFASDCEALGRYLSVCIEIARYERRLARRRLTRLSESGEVVHTLATLAALFEDEVISLVNAGRDRLAVVTHTLPQHCPPSITDEEVEADSSLSLIRRHWEREHGELYRQLCEEKAEWEAWLATPGLETAYWWARDVLPGLDDCNVIRPALALVLAQWQRHGIADEEITVDALFEEIFPVEE